MNVPEWIAGCMEVERKMSQLYGLLADKFDPERELFDTLRQEEMVHMQTLSLVEPTDDYSSKDISREARLLLRTLDAADRVINKVQFSAMGLEEALKAALSLEEGVVENFATTLPSVGDLNDLQAMDRMTMESTTHADMLREALIRNGFMYQS
jgi:rubrerythrin